MRATLSDVLRSLGACSESLAWADGYGSAWSTALTACPERSWLTCLYGRLLARGHVRREPLVIAACLCAREVLHLVPAGEERPLRAIETAEAWARGEATTDAVREARRVAYAAYAASAAYAYAAYAAAAAAYAADAAYAAAVYAAADAAYAAAVYAADAAYAAYADAADAADAAAYAAAYTAYAADDAAAAAADAAADVVAERAWQRARLLQYLAGEVSP